jgi:hypothetical protein
MSQLEDIWKYKGMDINDITPCSEENRWQDPPKWRIVKLNKDKTIPAKVRAVPGGVFDNESEAIACLIQKGDDYTIVKTDSLPRRCMEFCEIAKSGMCNYVNTLASDNLNLMEE